MAENTQNQGQVPGQEQGQNQGQSAGGDIQGEGNYDAARRYQKEQREFAQSGKVEQKAHEAEDAIEGEEGPELERARISTGSRGQDDKL